MRKERRGRNININNFSQREMHEEGLIERDEYETDREIEGGKRQHRCIKNNKCTRTMGEMQARQHKGMNIKQVVIERKEKTELMCVYADKISLNSQ